MTDTEIVFQVKQSPEGGYAHAVGHNIFTEADDWEHLADDAQCSATSRTVKRRDRSAYTWCSRRV